MLTFGIFPLKCSCISASQRRMPNRPPTSWRESDLRGIDSHGVARLHTYFEMLELGRINPRPKIQIIREKASVATVDGDNGLGLVVGPKANEIAMDKAEQHGSGWVSVCNTNHFGIAGYYPLKALERDLNRLGDDQYDQARRAALGRGANARNESDRDRISRLQRTADRHRHGDERRRLWENRNRLAQETNPCPKAGSSTKKAVDTTNPQDMIDGGAQLPLGSEREMGGHKGYGARRQWSIYSLAFLAAPTGDPSPRPSRCRQEIPDA